MYRTHTCGQLRAANVNETVTLAGWVQKVRNLGAMTFIDLRDRYGITQLVFNQTENETLFNQANDLGPMSRPWPADWAANTSFRSKAAW